MKGGPKIDNLTEESRRMKFRNWWNHYEWPILGALALVALILGFLGFKQYYKTKRGSLDILYLSLQLFFAESGAVTPVSSMPWKLEVARWLAPIISAYAALQAMAVIFQEQFKFLYTCFFRNHVIICGLGQKGMLLASSLGKQHKVIVIERDAENDFIAQCRDEGIIVFIGDAVDPDMLRKAKVKKASYLISVCGSDETNFEVAAQARKMVANRKGKALICTMHLVLPQLCRMLRVLRIHADDSASFRPEFFNIFDSGARTLLEKHPPYNKNINSDSLAPHIIVVGAGKMGENLVVHAARKWWKSGLANGRRLKITIIDREAKVRKRSLCQRYKFLDKTCELIAGQMDINSAEYQRGDFIDTSGKCETVKAYVCLDNRSLGLFAALTLLQCSRREGIPVIVRMSRETGGSFLIKNEDVGLHVFGLLDHTLKSDIALRGMNEVLARAVHDDYVQRCEERRQTPQDRSNMRPWDKLSEETQESNRLRADRICRQMESIGCNVELITDLDAESIQFGVLEVNKVAEMEHEEWRAIKEAAGWKWGEETIEEKKINENLRSWKELNGEAKEFNRDEVCRLPQMLASVGLQIYRHKNMFPLIENTIPDFMEFVESLAKQYSSGKLISDSDIEIKVREKFTSAYMDEMDTKILGWREMSEYADGKTLVHVISAFIALLSSEEYKCATSEQKDLLKWIILLHDIGKQIQKGQRDSTHAFRSAAILGKILPKLGFDYMNGPIEKHKRLANDWSRLTEFAKIERNDEWIQDNSKVGEIVDGIEKLFGADNVASAIIKTTLFHQSLESEKDWPCPAPLSDDDIKRFIDDQLLQLLKIMKVADSAAWNLFDLVKKEQYRQELLSAIEEANKVIMC